MENENRKTAQKWFIIGFVSAIFCLSVGFGIYYSWRPSLPSSSGAEKSVFQLGDLSGAEVLPPSIKTIEIKFSSGELRVEFSQGDELNWDCDGVGKNSGLDVLDSETVRLDFSSAIVDCDITIPTKKLKMEGLRGEVQLRKVRAAVDIQMINGEIFFQPLKNLHYRWNLNIESGTVDETLVSSEDAEAIPIKAEMKYGNIESLD